MSGYVSSNKSDIKDYFVSEYQRHITREGSDKLLTYLNNSDFFDAPASTRYHGNFEGGLVKHSLSVYYELKRLASTYDSILHYSEESIAICALLHDVCKIGCYKTEFRNVKEDGKWVQVPVYTFKEDFCYGGHGSKSVFLINKYMGLTDEEATAINCHMGAWEDCDKSSLSKAYTQFSLAWLLHVADEASTFLLNV